MPEYTNHIVLLRHLYCRTKTNLIIWVFRRKFSMLRQLWDGWVKTRSTIFSWPLCVGLLRHAYFWCNQLEYMATSHVATVSRITARGLIEQVYFFEPLIGPVCHAHTSGRVQSNLVFTLFVMYLNKVFYCRSYLSNSRYISSKEVNFESQVSEHMVSRFTANLNKRVMPVDSVWQ